MTRTPFDQFSKQLLETFLSPLGAVNVNREVPGESRWIDVWFEPTVQGAIAPETLGLLGTIAVTPCLIETFRNPPSWLDVCNCKHKLFSIFGELQRQAEREKRSLPANLDGLPWLWILTPSASENLLAQLEVAPDADGLPGIYFDRADRTALVAINQLPCTEETLWVRLLGRGKTQERAIAEVLAFPPIDPHRVNTLELLVAWKISLEVTNLVQQEENDVMVQLSQVYLEWKQQTRQEGIECGERTMILRILTHRVGELPAEVRSQIDRLTSPQLENLGEALFDFASLADLTQWLADHA